MQSQFQIAGQATQGVSLQQNKVLRNTYMLLALTMLPTVVGALVGVQIQFSFFAGSPLISFMLFLGIAFGFMWRIERTKDRGMGGCPAARLYLLHVLDAVTHFASGAGFLQR